MLNKFRFFYFILFVVLSIPTHGQRGFYTTDSSMTSGIKIIDGGELENAQWCQVKVKGKIIKYTPDEIERYGFNNGNIYVSKEIQILDTTKRVFLEHMEDGDINLFYYRDKGIKTYYLQKDSSLLIPLPKTDSNNFKYIEKLLNILTDCEHTTNATKLARYKKESLKKLINQHNTCEGKAFPFFKYGIISGYSGIKLLHYSDIENKNLSYFNYEYNYSFLAGAFIENPISMSQFSFRTEMHIAKYAYSYNVKNSTGNIDFIANMSSVHFPVMLKYSTSSVKFRPYISLGGILTYNHKNESIVYESSINQSVVEINETNSTPSISDFYAGYTIGCGIDYNLDYRHILFIEIRFNNSYGQSEYKTFDLQGINILTGINF